MAGFDRREIEETHDRLVEVRERAERGEAPWSALADFFVEDATFIDPGWGRVVGRPAIGRFLDESMAGLEGWTFPLDWRLVHDDLIVTRWWNRLPGRRADGSPYQAPGISTLYYAGEGRFRYEEDLLNMVHVHELIRESRWKPGPGFRNPPSPPPR